MAWDGTGEDPWLPERIAGEVDLQKAERKLYHEWLGAAASWLTTVRRAVLAPFRRDRARGRPDPTAVHAFGRDWTEAMNEVVDGPVKEIMEAGYEQVLGEGYDWDTRPAATEHLAAVRNRMVRTPDEVFSMVAAELARAANLGETPAEIAARVDEVLTTTGTERWRARASTVARTETAAALGTSRHDSYVAQAEELGGEWEHGWLATCCDGRTRPAHWEADGMRVPLSQPFMVGGEPLLFPGDPTGSASNTINCRCSTVLLRPDEEWDLTGRQFRDEVVAVTASAAVFHLPGEHRQEDHAGDNDVREVLDAAGIERDYGPELDVVEFAEDLFAVAHPDVVTIQGRDEKDDDRFEILSWTDPAAAREWADLIDRIVEDAEVYDRDDPDATEVSPNGLVDWLFDDERGLLVGYDRVGDVMVRFGDFTTDRAVDNINGLDGFDLSGDEPAGFARALEDLADRAEEGDGEDETAVTAAGVRRVRTKAGEEQYDQPIGTIITRDLPKLTVPALRALAKERGIKLPTQRDLGHAPRRADIEAAVKAALATESDESEPEQRTGITRPVAQPARKAGGSVTEFVGNYEARQRSLEIPHGDPTVTKLEGGISADTDLLTYPDGARRVRKRYGRGKPDKFDRLPPDREEAAALVLDAFGVPTPAMTRVDDFTLLMEYVGGRQGGESGVLKAPLAVRTSDQGRLLGLADAVMGLRDRNGGGWKKLPDGIVIIDHGGAFGHGEHSAYGNPFASYLMTRDKWKRDLDLDRAQLDAIRPRLEALRSEFQRLGLVREHKAMLDRFDAIRRNTKVQGRRVEVPSGILPGPKPRDRNVETDEPDLTLQAGLDAKARRAAARAAIAERRQQVARGTGTARLLAEVDELIGKKADDATIRARLDPALLGPEQLFADADPAVLPALERALATGDRAKLRAALTRQAKKAGITPIGRAGQKVAFDPEQHETFGDAALKPGDQVEVVRRGSTLTLPDGEMVQLDRPRVVGVARPVPAKRPGRAREPSPEERSRQRQAEIDRVTKVADAAATIDELLDARDDEIGDPRVLHNRIETLTVPDDVRGRMLAAVDSGDAAGLLRVVEEYAASEDLTPIGRAGDVVAFDRQIHTPLGRVEDGARVVVVRRGYRRGGDGQMISNPTVEALEPGGGRGGGPSGRGAGRPTAGGGADPAPAEPTPSAERLAGRAVYKAIPVRDTASLDRAITGEPGQFADIAGVPGNRIRDAIGDYESSGYQYVAAALRDAGGDLSRVSDEAPQVRGLIPSHYSRRRVLDQAEGIDAVMTVSRTTGPIEVHRGVDRGEDIFGGPLPTSLVGREWTEHSYVSTTISEKVARKAAGDGSGLRMRIHVPEGVGAIGVENSSPGLRTEREVLLDRNLTARVVADRVERGERVIDVEIVAGPDETSRPPEPPTGMADPSVGTVPEAAGVDYAARVAAVARLAATPPTAEPHRLGGGQMADTTLLTHADGRLVSKVYGRRVPGGRAEIRRQVDAETLGPLVLEAFGVRSAATHRVSDTEIIQEHIDGQIGWGIAPFGSASIPQEILDGDDGRLMGFADVVIENPDRNEGNWGQDPDRRLFGIDFGEAFPAVGGRFSVPNPFVAHYVRRPVNRDGTLGAEELIDNDLSPDDVASVRARLEALESRFAALGRGPWLRRMLRRLDQVGKHAKGTRDRIGGQP